jgi:hypothetical protein
VTTLWFIASQRIAKKKKVKAAAPALLRKRKPRVAESRKARK